MRSQLLPGRVAIIDVETTGFSPAKHDRILEIAAVVVNLDCEIEREFVTLLNPARDVGPTRVHGITALDVLSAPRFEEIVGQFIDVVSGVFAVCGHNVNFDRRFLEHEFGLIDSFFPEAVEICTRRLAGGGALPNCCELFGVELTNHHSALDDARATAQLLKRILMDSPGCFDEYSDCTPIVWPRVKATNCSPVPRQSARLKNSEPPGYLQRLLARVDDDPESAPREGVVLAYIAMLDRILEDRLVTELEGEQLVEATRSWGLNSEQVLSAHRDYMNHLAIAALTDGVVTDDEMRELSLVGRLLGVDEARIKRLLVEASDHLRRSGHTSIPNDTGSIPAGTRVCFTGESTFGCNGVPLTREMSESMARKHGLEVASSVTKKLEVLVVADPHTQSGKAAKARKYGIRIIHEPVFWGMLGVDTR